MSYLLELKPTGSPLDSIPPIIILPDEPRESYKVRYYMITGEGPLAAWNRNTATAVYCHLKGDLYKLELIRWSERIRLEE